MRSPETYLALGIVVLLFLAVSLGSVPLVSAYTSHEPILITNNSMFDEAHGVTGGTGTESDPYRIEGWEITGTSGVNGIDIQNTTAYFIIRDCSITNVTVWAGIYILNVTNGRIVNNYCHAGTFGHGYGILVVESSHITVSYNIVEDTLHGIYISWSDYCTLDSNDVTHVASYGIFLMQANNTAVTNNTSSYNKWGILLYDFCGYNEIANNVCEHNAAYDIGLFNNCNYNTLTGNFCGPNGIFFDTTCISNELSGNTDGEISYETDTLPGPFPDPSDPGDTPDIPSADPAMWLPVMSSFALIAGMAFIGFNLSKSSHDPMPGLFMMFVGIMLAWSIGWLPTWIFVTAIALIAIISAALWSKLFKKG
ncbi:MAG: right-handed parallel beta-helix repeat-containing protein [Desulfobacterales bacterium]|nr:right-handed parallel beta-helix repeat-containing protein [Desulfobacterales bacterium]